MCAVRTTKPAPMRYSWMETAKFASTCAPPDRPDSRDLMLRNYQHIITEVARHQSGKATRDVMRLVVDLLWKHLHSTGISWVGFYIDQPHEADERRLVLGPCRDKPACSPIGVHGVCGAALRTKSVQIVRDVKALGPNYIACDPRDRSEIVVPLLRPRHDAPDVERDVSASECWGVLDVDSWDFSAFDERDAEGLQGVLREARLLHSPKMQRLDSG
jgi:putative methionine-R-sulfoxide reductase with GAF domain